MNSFIPHFLTEEDKLKNHLGTDRSQLYDKIKIVLGKACMTLNGAKAASYEKKNYSSTDKVDSFVQSLNETCQKIEAANTNFGNCYVQETVSPFETAKWDPKGNEFKTSLESQYQSSFDDITSLVHDIGKKLEQVNLFFNSKSNIDVWLSNDLNAYETYYRALCSIQSSFAIAVSDFNE